MAVTDNVYFAGKVRSLDITNPSGNYTVGVMEVGEWEFNAPTREWMTLLTGKWEVQLPGETEFRPFGEGEAYEIAKDESFRTRIIEPTAYICRYE